MHRVHISLTPAEPPLLRAHAVLPNGTTIDVLRDKPEDAIRECSNQCHKLAGEAGMRVVTVLPMVRPDWSLPWWSLPRYRAFDPDLADDVQPLPTAERQTPDGPTPLPLDALPGMEPEDSA